MIPHRLALSLPLVLSASLALAAPTAKPATGSHAATARAAARGACKEPGGKSPELKAGLEAYGKGDWTAAAAHLSKWAAQPGADTDPAAVTWKLAQTPWITRRAVASDT